MKNLKGHIFLVGFMGSGKTSTTYALSRELGVGEFDTDSMIEQKQGMEISKVFESRGEEGFRRLETEILQDLAECSPGVVSCGGGMVLRPENVRLMKQQGRILLLKATPETIYDRVKDSTNRPLLVGNMNVEYIRSLMAQRESAYQTAADLSVDTDGLSPEDVAERIVALPNLFLD